MGRGPSPGAPSENPRGPWAGGKAEAELFSPFSVPPGVYIQSSQIVESSGLYTLVSVLKAQLVTADKDALFYCELSYRLPSGNHMKESREVSVQVFCESQRGPGPRLVAAPASSPVWGRLWG